MNGYTQERWFRLLREAADSTSITGVALRIGMSRAAVSLVLSGKYPADPVRLAGRVMAVLDRWPCPYLGADISADDCRAVHACATPSHDPARLAHRRVCRSCIHKTQGETS